MKRKKRNKKLTTVDQAPDEQLLFVGQDCKNCGYHFGGNYCPSCGQSIKDIQQPVSHFVRDLFSTVFAFDLRLFRSLPLLLFKPGILSNHYIAGQRKRYMAPFRLFFFSSLIFFFLVGWQTKRQVDDVWNDPEFVAEQDTSVLGEDRVGSLVVSQDTVVAISGLKEGLGMINLIRQSLEEELASGQLNEEERLRKLSRQEALENPEYLISKAYQYISWSFFILMPWFALLLLLFFRRKRKYYVEHLVFAVNLHTFFFLLLTILVLLSMIIPNLLSGMGGWIVLFGFAYAVIGVRNFYQKKWLPSLFSTAAIFLLYFFSILLISVLIAILLITQFNLF